jgi:hypothetical protein
LLEKYSEFGQNAAFYSKPVDEPTVSIITSPLGLKVPGNLDSIDTAVNVCVPRTMLLGAADWIVACVPDAVQFFVQV